MSLYQNFKTDPRAEQEGIVIDYGDYRVTVARAGGANKRYLRLLDKKSRPFRRAIAAEVMDHERSMELLRECYAEAVIRDWETLVAGEFRTGIEPPDAPRDEQGNLSPDVELLPVTVENLLLTFNNLPAVFEDLQDQASKITLFRAALREEAAKNS